MYAYLTNSFENGVEFTYPEVEHFSTGILQVFSSMYGVVLVMILGEVIKHFGEFPAHAIMSLVLFLGLMMNVLINNVKKRQDASINIGNDSQYLQVELK